MVTAAPGRKLVPVIVTRVPPVVGPDGGATAVGFGAGSAYRNPPGSAANCVSGFVTTISQAPAAWGGVVHMIVVPVRLLTATAKPPQVTVAPARKPLPVMTM